MKKTGKRRVFARFLMNIIKKEYGLMFHVKQSSPTIVVSNNNCGIIKSNA